MQSHPVNFLLPALPCPWGHRIAKGTGVQVVAILGIAGMCFLCCWHGDIRKVGISGTRNGLLIERVPCDVNLGNVVEVPAQTCGNGAEGRTLDENLAIIASDNKDFLLRVQRWVKHKPELAVSACTANTVDKGNYSSRILYRWCLGIYKGDSVVFFVYHDAPCVAGDFRGRDWFNVKICNINCRTFGKRLLSIGYCNLIWTIAQNMESVIHIRLVRHINAECLCIHSGVLGNKRERESATKIYCARKRYFKPVVSFCATPCSWAKCSVFTVKHICKGLAVVVPCEVGILQFNLIARCIEQFKRIETHTFVCLCIFVVSIGRSQGKTNLIAITTIQNLAWFERVLLVGDCRSSRIVNIIAQLCYQQVLYIDTSGKAIWQLRKLC